MGNSPNFEKRRRFLFVDMNSEKFQYPSEFLGNSKDYKEFENLYISQYKSSIESNKTINLLDNDMSSFFADLATKEQSFMSFFYGTTFNSIADILMYELKDFNWESVKEFIKDRLYLYIAIKEKNKLNVPKNISTNEELSNYCEHSCIAQALKQLELNLNSSEDYELTKLEKINLKWFFENLNADSHLTFIRDFSSMWRAKPSKDSRIIYILIYLICFPDSLNIEIETFKKMIADIKQSNIKFAKEGLSNGLLVYIDKDSFQKPLHLSIMELEYILKEVFGEEVDRNTIRKYCKEMNLKIKSIGKGKKVNLEKIEHPFL